MLHNCETVVDESTTAAFSGPKRRPVTNYGTDHLSTESVTLYIESKVEVIQR